MLCVSPVAEAPPAPTGEIPADYAITAKDRQTVRGYRKMSNVINELIE
jgi:hypothetical protein